MNDKLIANICTVLSTMKADQKWTDRHDEAFLVGMEDLPDEVGLLLRREILKHFDWRPSVKDVRDLWTSISSPKPVAADELVAKLYALRRRFGQYVVPSTDVPGVMKPGEPAWTDMNMKRLSAARGGWVQFCEEESNPTNSAQLLKLATVVLGSTSDNATDALRLEYQAGNARTTAHELPDAPLDGLEAPQNGMGHQSGEYTQTGKAEAAQAISRIQARTGDLRLTR